MSARASVAAPRLATLLVGVIGVAALPLRREPLGLAAAATCALWLLVRPTRASLLLLLGASLSLLAVQLPALVVAAPLATSRFARSFVAVGLAIVLGARLGLAGLAPALAGCRAPRALVASVSALALQLDELGEQARRLLLARRLRGLRGTAIGLDTVAALLSRTSARAERVELAARLRGPNVASRPAAPWDRRELRLTGLATLCVAALHVATRFDAWP